MEEVRIKPYRRIAQLQLCFTSVGILFYMLLLANMLKSYPDCNPIAIAAFSLIIIALGMSFFKSYHQLILTTTFILNAEGLTVKNNPVIPWTSLGRLCTEYRGDYKLLRVGTQKDFYAENQFFHITNLEFEYSFEELIQLIERYREYYKN